MIFDQIVIPGQVISKKNTQRVTSYGGHSSIRASKAYEAWEKSAKIFMAGRIKFKKVYPIFLHFEFVMKNDRGWDWNNLSQGPQDILVQMGIMAEDNYRYCIPVFFGKYAGVYKDKDNPRLTLTFTDLEELRKPDFLEGEEAKLNHYKHLAEVAEKKKGK